MKIAFISRWFWDEHHRGQGIGGTEQDRVRACMDLGHQIIVLSQRPESAQFEEHYLNGCRVITTDRWERSARWSFLDKIAKPFFHHRKIFTDTRDLLSFLRKYGPFDFVEAQCEEPDGILVALAKRFRSLPPSSLQVFALRYRFAGAKPVFEQKSLLRFAFRGVNLVKANSLLVRDIIQTEYSYRGIPAVVPPNLSSEFLTASELGTSVRADGTIFCPATINRTKGILEFVRAAQILRSEGFTRTFEIAGRATGSDDYEREARSLAASAGLDDQLKWLGQLQGAELRAAFLRSAVVVIPSLFDAWNRASIEAVALARPVAITDGCGAAGYLKQRGAAVVCEAGNPSDLARAIAAALHPEMSESAKKAASVVRSELNPDAIARQNLELYQQVLRSSPPGP